MDPKHLFAKALEQANDCIRRIKPDDLGRSTPCAEWDLRALLNHMVYELLWMPDLLMGKTVAEVGSAHDGNVLRSDYAQAWKHAADAASVAVMHVPADAMINLSRGDVPANEYIIEMTAEMLIHGWDVGRSLQCSPVFDHDAAQAVYDYYLPKKATMSNNGDFAGAIDVPADATLQVKLLALTGRHADTTP